VGGEAETLAKLAHLGLTVVNPALLTIAEQAKLVASAAVVISPHGSALANLVFATPGTRVLEFHQPRYAPPYFHGIAQHGRLDLFRSVQPSLAPEPLQELFYEGASLEPIQLEPQLVELALVKVLNADSLH
jgi:capsular polysaccharide biosynthesis protein